MASYQDKVLVNDAITDGTKMDLSFTHITSNGWMQISPIMNKELVPGEHIKVGVESLVRMNQMPVPTYGRCNLKKSAYFVPYRTIFRGWNDFITDSPHTNSSLNPENVGTILAKVPYVTNTNLVKAFLSGTYDGVGYEVLGSNYAATRPTLPGEEEDVYCITGATSAAGVSLRFTMVGQTILKVVESLGYKIQWNVNDNTEYSALPLLAFAKVYCDWYFPQDYTNTAIYNYLYMLCNADTGVPYGLSKVDVGRILQMAYVCYDSDYFVSAWDHPNSPNTGTYSGDFKITNIDSVRTLSQQGGWTNGKGFVANTSRDDISTTEMMSSADAPFISGLLLGQNPTGGTQYGATPISQYLLNGLKALSDYMARHKLSGSAAFQRYLSRFGKALSSEKLNRSVFLGTDLTPIQIGDVYSTSNMGADGFNGLGEYAGKGIGFSTTKDFEYSTDEFGMFLVVASVVPAIGYFQGIDRNVKHLTKLDYWTPEFDALSVQPITADELYMSYNGASDFGFNGSGKTIHNQVFGFTPRYAEYKRMIDKCTGIYRIPTLNGDVSGSTGDFLGSSSWHLLRTFSDSDFGGAVSGMVHSVDFVYARNDYGDYNRMFANQSPDAPDQFTAIHNFNIVSYSPMKSLYDTYEFNDKGSKQIMQANGVIKN